MTRPTDPRTAAVVDAIRAAARYESDPDVIAARVVAALDEHDRRTHVETRAEAVRLVEDVIDAHLGADGTPDVDTGTAIVDALIGRPVASITDDGLVGLAWPEGSAAAIVSRDVLDNLAERVNRVPELEAEIARTGIRAAELERTVARLRHLGAAAEDAAVEGDLARLEALVIDRRPELTEPGTVSPDCKAGKCSACTGDAWSDRLDARTDCEHPCHTPDGTR